MQKLCTLFEIAQANGVPYQTLYWWVRAKGIRPVRRAGNANLYNLNDILYHFAFIDGRIYDLDKARMLLARSGGESTEEADETHSH